MNVDAAYAVQVLVAATNIKYGGPNTNAGANAWGGFVFEAWDPQPRTANSTLAVDANGRVDVGKTLGQAVTLDANNALNVSTKWVAGTVQTAGDIPAKTNSLTFTGANKVDASVRDWVGDAIPARNVAGVPLVDLKYVLGTISPAAAGSVRADQVTGAVGSVTGNVGGNVAGSVASVTARVTANVDQVDGAALTAHAAGKLPADVLTVAGTVQTARDLGGQLDAAVSTRLAAASITLTLGKVDVNDKTGFALTAAYDPAKTAAQAATAVSNADYTAARAAKLDNLDVAVSTRGDATAANQAIIDGHIATRAAPGDAMTLTAGERNSTADALLERNVAGGSSAGRKVKESLAFLRNRWTIAGDTLTVYDTDDVTVLWTAAMTRTAGDPVSSSDPA
jgi:hypothetical protein